LPHNHFGTGCSPTRNRTLLRASRPPHGRGRQLVWARAAPAFIGDETIVDSVRRVAALAALAEAAVDTVLEPVRHRVRTAETVSRSH
jgi:hypothetical protein